MPIGDDYYTISQLARVLCVTRQTIHRWEVEGRIIGEKVGRETLFPKSIIKSKGNICPTCGQFIKGNVIRRGSPLP